MSNRKRSVHPLPRACRWWGHYWHNDHSRYMALVPDECLRPGCYGDGHKWDHDRVEPGRIAVDLCVYPDCDAERRWAIPDMSDE